MAIKKLIKNAIKKRTKKTGYQSDVGDEEWAFCAPYLVLMKEDAPQREHSSRELFNAVELHRASRLSVENAAQRSAAVAHHLPTGSTLDEGRLL